MENEILKQILLTQNMIMSRLDNIEARLDRLDEMKAQQAKDSNLLRILFDNSINLTERITSHDLIFDALQNVLEERKQEGAAY